MATWDDDTGRYDSGLYWDGGVFTPPSSPRLTDIAILWSNDTQPAGGDWHMQGADLLRGGDLGTAILVSLFSDRQARADDVIPDGTTNRRGWWGDPDLGSRLWLLDRAKLTQQTALIARDYAAEGVQWLIDDGVVAVFDIAAEVRLPQTLWLTVTAFRTKADKAANQYAWAWAQPLYSQAA